MTILKRILVDSEIKATQMACERCEQLNNLDATECVGCEENLEQDG